MNQAMPSTETSSTPPERVVVAMSGGVDSSVTAALLKEQGHEVIGVTLQLYNQGEAAGRKGACCAGQDIRDARRVAERIGIPHYVLDFEQRFRSAVIDDFADTYLAGETPIPCVRCNQRVKFRDMLDVARDLGATAMATGHYVRRIEGPRGPELHAGSDERRDQSYFLFATTREQLDFLRFPLGDLEKDDVRRMAARLDLPVAQKPDSQDICFVPSGSYTGIIERLRPGAAEAGEIVDLAGQVLGRHEGIIHYTIGQRRGLGIASEAPLYVVRLDAATRRVVVGPREALLCAGFELREVNWLDAEAPQPGREIRIKVRSTQRPLAARIEAVSGTHLTITLLEHETAVAPGQAGVIYDGDRVLGGGWITAPRALLVA